MRKYVIQMDEASLISQQCSVGKCIIIDLALGTSRKSGLSGRGVSFDIVSRGQSQMTLRYEAPLTAWTAEQWAYAARGPHPTCSFAVEHVPHRQKLIMNYGK